MLGEEDLSQLKEGGAAEELPLPVAEAEFDLVYC